MLNYTKNIFHIKLRNHIVLGFHSANVMLLSLFLAIELFSCFYNNDYMVIVHELFVCFYFVLGTDVCLQTHGDQKTTLGDRISLSTT